MEATELHDRDSISLLFGSSATARFVDFGYEPGSPSGSYPTEEEENPAGQEEDEDEYVAELTRQMANYMLQDDDKHEKSWGGSGSPQSTLWSPFGTGYGSPIGPSREPSPPLTPAAEKMKAKDEMNPVLVPFPSKQALIDDQIKSVQANFRKMKEEREKEKREAAQQNDGVSVGNRARAASSKHYAATKFGGNYQRTGSGVKAVFVNGSGSRPGSAGTGVFLPRGTGAVLEPRKKTGTGGVGARVIIPARVVEALKLHSDKTGVPSKFTSDFPPHHDALLVAMNNNDDHNNNKNKNSWSKGPKGQSYAAALLADSHREPTADLPPEWTY